MLPLALVYLLISFGTGVYAQLYRYFRVASPVERQQLKWVIVGLAGFVSIAVVVLLPLNRLLISQAGSMDPTRALVLSTIPDTLFRAISLFIPVSIAISVLRYRLWEIDLIISRTLVYGAVTASVVGLYVLIVGGLSIVLQTQNNLPGIIIAILLIAFLFQPLRRRLQDIVNHFVPVPQSTSPSEQPEDKITISEGTAATPFPGHQLFVARVIWVALAILTVAIFIAALPGYVSEISEYVPASRMTVTLARDIVLYVSGSVASIASALLSFILAVMLVWRKPNERMAVFVSCYLLLLAAILGGALERTVLVWPVWEAQASAISKPLLFATPTVALLALFPSGRFVPLWTRWLTLCSVLLIAATFYLPPYWWPDVGNPIAGVIAILWAAILLAVLYAQVYRYRRVSNATERQQTKWVVFGFFLWLLLVTVVSGPYAITYGSTPFAPHPWWAPVVRAIWFLSSAILPISLTIAVMRYRLFDIDLLINRAVVYLTLTAIVVGIYVLIVGYLSMLFQTGNNLAISLIATGLVAVVFQPLRQRLQRGINHLMYGERDEPYAVLSRLGQRLEAAYAPESVLSTIVETVSLTLKLPYVGISLNQDGEFKIAAEFGRSKLESIALPLIYQGESVGELILAPRAPGERFMSAERQLLDDLARQAGVAAHAVRLTADLQRSRERLVTAREEERRRLRRDLHDGLGASLAALHLQAGNLRHLLAQDPAAADALVSEWRAEIRTAIADIRRLVYDLRPPALDELGLVGAIRSRAAQTTTYGETNSANGLQVTVDASSQLPALPAAIEVAAYRIAQEAITNVVRHAHARHCTVRLSLDDALHLEISDDGTGLPRNAQAGVGLTSMRERAAELGGTCAVESGPTAGTRVLVCLPLPKE